MENQIHHFDDLDYAIYLREEEHNMLAQEDDCSAFEVESQQYHKGYQNSIDDLQKKLKFLSRDELINKGRPGSNQPSSNQQNP